MNFLDSAFSFDTALLASKLALENVLSFSFGTLLYYVVTDEVQNCFLRDPMHKGDVSERNRLEFVLFQVRDDSAKKGGRVSQVMLVESF